MLTNTNEKMYKYTARQTKTRALLNVQGNPNPDFTGTTSVHIYILLH
jgi:hypothetical protein